MSDSTVATCFYANHIIQNVISNMKKFKYFNFMFLSSPFRSTKTVARSISLLVTADSSVYYDLNPVYAFSYVFSKHAF